MKATILDTVTGQMAVVDGPRSFEWAENGWSCDCNRSYWNAEVAKPNCVCERFLVIDAVFDDPEDWYYTLEELNAGYPQELLAKHNLTNKEQSYA